MPVAELQTHHAFTAKGSGLSRRLLSSVTIIYEGQEQLAKALWDTGATGTCISTDIANSLGLVSTGKMNICTPSGSKQVNTYLLDIGLPNQVEIKDVPVCDSDIGGQGIDMLIGMDIIIMGDFAVSNYDGQTVFTFRIPSKKHADFVQQESMNRFVGEKHGKGVRKRK